MEDTEMVDWEANENAIKLIPTHWHHWLTKEVSGMSGVKKMMKIWGQSKDNEFPQCGEQETTAPIMECKDEAVIQ